MKALLVLAICVFWGWPNTHTILPQDVFETSFLFVKEKTDFGEVKVGIIPHHLLAADLIASFFYNLEGKDYEIIILLGPDHFGFSKGSVSVSGFNWQTPYGMLQTDQKIKGELGFKEDEAVFKKEHSIQNILPFIKRTFPKAKIVALVLKGESDSLPEKLFEISQRKKILVLASVDFSHGKISLEAQAEDKKSIQALESLNDSASLDVDSPSSIRAIIKLSQLQGSKFRLLANTNSAILTKTDIPNTTSYIVGYFVK